MATFSASLNITHLANVLLILRKNHFNETKYYDLGLMLGLYAPTLDAIRADNIGNINGCLMSCLSAWLRKADNVNNPTYESLVAALRRIGEIAVAEGIHSELARGEDTDGGIELEKQHEGSTLIKRGHDVSSMTFDSPRLNKIDHGHIENAMKNGSVKFYVTKAVIQGEARAGKTSVKCLLLSQKYDDESSTSCIEAPWVGVRCYGNTGEKWELVNEEGMSVRVAAEVHSTAEKPETLNTLPVSHDKPLFKKLKMKSAPLRTRHSADRITENIKKVQEFYTKCKENQENVLRLCDQRWLYFIDSGGQLPFQKLLPRFMPFASVLILVINLAKNLSDASSTAMQIQTTTASTGGHSVSIEEVLKQMVSAIGMSTQQYKSLIAQDDLLSQGIKFGDKSTTNDTNRKLKVIAIATHEDEMTNEHETLDDKEDKLYQMFKAMESICEIAYVEEDWTSSILHVIDGRKAKDCGHEMKEKYLEMVGKLLNDNAYEMTVPLKWHCFGVLLHEVTKEGCGVLSLLECQDLGFQLASMSPEEVVSALKFLHILNKLLYYHDSPAASKMVFVRLNSLIDIIRDLVKTITEAHQNEVHVSADIKKLATNGVLSHDVLQKISPKYLSILEKFADFKESLPNLLEHLHIAIVRSNCYLMPALLPIKEVSNVAPFSNTSPLLFYFEKNVPMGLFCIFIVHLLRNRKLWILQRPDDPKYSNYFTLQNRNMGQFDFVEKFDCIEVHAESPSDQSKKVIENAIEETCGSITPDKAFYCQCGTGNGERHVAVICENGILCKVSGVLPLTETMEKWLKDTGTRTGGRPAKVFCIRPENVPSPPPERYPEMNQITSKSMKFEEALVSEVEYLLVTVSKTEFRTVMGYLKPDEKHGEIIKTTTKDRTMVTLYIGKYGLQKAAVVKMIKEGPVNAGMTIGKVLDTVKPKYVIAVGVCWGMDDETQKPADVLVARNIFDFTLSRHGETVTIRDPKCHEVHPTLWNMFSSEEGFHMERCDGNDLVQIFTGTIVAKPDLVANKKHKQDIKGLVPDAIGGEMEGAGIMAAVIQDGSDFKVEAIIVKGIADWGDETKADCKVWKPFAAHAAARYVHSRMNEACY